MKPPAESQTAQPLLLGGGVRPAVESGSLPTLALRLLSDERLARLAAKGDRAAFGVVFDRYHGELYRYCLSLLRNPDDASDALQSAMVRALRALEGETREIALRPWLYRIAHNEAMTLIRRRPRADAVSEHQPAALDVESSAEARATLNQLLDDIRELPDRQRGALVMRELGGLEYSEIAAALETSPAAAKQAIYEARKALFEQAKGRDMDCDGVRRMLSDGDGRTARGRALRAHLRDCTDCREFQELTAARSSALASLLPGMPAGAAGVIRSLVAGSSSGGISGLGAVAGLGAPVAVKSIATLVAAVALGTGASSVLDGNGSSSKDPDTGVLPAKTQHAAPSAARQATDHGRDRARGGKSSAQGRRAARRRGARRDEPRGARGERQPGSGRPGATSNGTGPAAQAPAATQPAPASTQQQQSQPIQGHHVPQTGVGVADQVVPVVTGPVDNVATQVQGVTDTVTGTVEDVQSQLPVRTPRLP